MTNQIIGNFNGNIQNDDEERQKIKEDIKNETSKAHKNKHSFDRQNLFLEQIRKIDFFREIAIKTTLTNLVTQIEPKLAPLIIVLPFNNPDIKKLYNNDKRIDLIQTEQTQNYIVDHNGKEDLKLAVAGSQIVMDRIRYLDDVSYLHSTFDFSPVIRLPIQGKSIYT